MSGTLRVTNPNGTYFKLRPEQSTDLQKNEVYKVEKNQTFSYSSIDPGEFGGHYKVHFAPTLKPQDWPNGVQTWYVYPADVAV